MVYFYCFLYMLLCKIFNHSLFYSFQLAMTCLQLHSEMALQASRALESTEDTSGADNIGLPSTLAKGMIKIPGRNIEL